MKGTLTDWPQKLSALSAVALVAIAYWTLVANNAIELTLSMLQKAGEQINEQSGRLDRASAELTEINSRVFDGQRKLENTYLELRSRETEIRVKTQELISLNTTASDYAKRISQSEALLANTTIRLIDARRKALMDKYMYFFVYQNDFYGNIGTQYILSISNTNELLFDEAYFDCAIRDDLRLRVEEASISEFGYALLRRTHPSGEKEFFCEALKAGAEDAYVTTPRVLTVVFTSRHFESDLQNEYIDPAHIHAPELIKRWRLLLGGEHITGLAYGVRLRTIHRASKDEILRGDILMSRNYNRYSRLNMNDYIDYLQCVLAVAVVEGGSSPDFYVDWRLCLDSNQEYHVSMLNESNKDKKELKVLQQTARPEARSSRARSGRGSPPRSPSPPGGSAPR